MECVKLGDYCDITSSKRVFANQYVEKGVPFYRSREIIEKKEMADISEPLFISEELYETFRKKFGVPIEGDLLLTSVGTLGIPYIVKNERFYFKDGNLTWMKNFKKELSSKYLYYWLNSKFGKESLINRAIGSSQAALTIAILKKYKIFLPTLRNQNQIVDILSAYDNLIENNNKRIKILEQMAENLYKEWFTYEKIKDISKEVRLKDIISIIRGVSYTTEEIETEEGTNLVNLKNIQAYGGFRRDGLKLYAGKYKKEQIVSCGDLIMGVTDMTQDRRTVGYVALVPQVEGISVISADLIRISSPIQNVFLYAMFKYGKVSKYISQFANGANVLHLKPQTILGIKILLPQQTLIDKYVNIASEFFNKIEYLSQMNGNLTKQRDMLLPRLMSGKLEVK